MQNSHTVVTRRLMNDPLYKKHFVRLPGVPGPVCGKKEDDLSEGRRNVLQLYKK